MSEKTNGHINRTLYWAVRNGQSIDNIPGVVKQVIAKRTWLEFLVEETGEIVTFDSFADFISSHPPEGLGTTIDTIKRLCGDDIEARNMIDAECKREPGNPTDERGENGRYEPIVDNVNNWDNRPVGNSLDAGLRRLRKEVERKTPKAKELQAKVFAQEVSVNAALIELGIRKKTVTIPVEVARAARAIKRHFTDEQVRELKDLL